MNYERGIKSKAGMRDVQQPKMGGGKVLAAAAEVVHGHGLAILLMYNDAIRSWITSTPTNEKESRNLHQLILC